MEPELSRVTVRVAEPDAQMALALLWVATGTGCQERTLDDGVAIEVWLAPEHAGDGRWIERRLAAEGIEAHAVVDRQEPGWLAGQRRFHRPFTVADRLRVRPPWEPGDPDLLDVAVDPGMAFGTGQHATTRCCLELLCEIPAGGSLLDVGCGSGILAIAARRLGFDPVRAVDHDPDSVAAALDNARANGVGMAVARRDLDDGDLPPADVVVANLTATLLRRLAPALTDAPPERAIVSGLRPDEVAGACGAFAPTGLRERRVVERDGWAAALLEAM